MEMFIILFSLAGIAAMGILSPGPDFLAVSHASVSASKKEAGFVATGVVIGNGVWAGAALFGVGTLFALFPSFFLAFKVCGALYLMYLGVKMFKGAKTPFQESQTKEVLGYMNCFKKGLVTTLANPKAAVYYASALSAIAPSNASMSLLALMLLTVVGVAALWFSFVVFVLSSKSVSKRYKKAKVYIESLFGSLIFLFGLKQLFSR